MHNKSHCLAVPFFLSMTASREVKVQPLNVKQHTSTELDDVDVISAFDIHDVDSYDSDLSHIS